MQNYLEGISHLLLRCENLFKEFIHGRVVIFFINHIKACDHAPGVLLALLNLVEHQLNVWLSGKFQAANDYLHLEEGISNLNDFLNFVEDIDFSFQGDGAVFIKQKSENVSVLDDGDHLFDVVLADLDQDFLKEICVVVQLVSQHEFRLEISPNTVIFRAGWPQQDVFFELVIKCYCILSILSQSVDFHVARQVTSILVGKEEIFFLGVKDVVIVS